MLAIRFVIGVRRHREAGLRPRDRDQIFTSSPILSGGRSVSPNFDRQASRLPLQGARDLFRSLARLKALPGYLEVLPGALAGSVCRPGLSGNPASTTGFQRRNNAAFRIDGEESFVALMLRDIPPPPQRGRVPRRQRRTRDGVTGGRGPWLAALSCEGANHEESFKFGGRDGGRGVRSGGASLGLRAAGAGIKQVWLWAVYDDDVERWGYGMIFGPLLMIFVLVVAIAAAVVLVRVGSAGRGGGHNRGTKRRRHARRSIFSRSGTRAAKSTWTSSKSRRVLGD